MIRATIAAAALALLAATPAGTQGPVMAGATGTLAAEILAAHNRERAAVGSAPLQWDPQLAAAAASYGPVLGRLGDLQHSPRETRPGQRENLAMAWHGTMNAGEIVGLWIAEKKMLQPGIFPAVSRTGNWEDVGHYTQLVWPTTTRVGCAIYSTDWDYLICRYTPPGNEDGKPVFATASLNNAALASR
jgi:hypothetical protein